MAKEINKTTITQQNNIVYVEPNYTYSTDMRGTNGINTYEFIPPAEDYSIYVNLKVEIRGRTIRTKEDVNTLSLSYETDISGKTKINILQGTKIPINRNGVKNKDYVNYLTTNYTDIFLGDLKKKGPSIETFGISSIDLSYNNYMVPEVTIEFVDIRGVSLFAQKEAYETRLRDFGAGVKDADVDISNTFFQCFFTFPYPKFTLMVKGFYGQPVSYELTCADFRARFDSKTGNFNCTAKFVGYYFSFLGDVMFNILCAAPYSDYLGDEYWKNRGFTLDGVNGKKPPMPKIIELIKLLKHVDRISERKASNSPEIQELIINEKEKTDIASVKNAYEAFVSKYRDKMISSIARNKANGINLENFFEAKAKNDVTVAMVYFAPIKDVVTEGGMIETLDEYLGIEDDANQALSALIDAIDEYNSRSARYRKIDAPKNKSSWWAMGNRIMALSDLSTPDSTWGNKWGGSIRREGDTDSIILPSIYIRPNRNQEGKAYIDWNGKENIIPDIIKRNIESYIAKNNEAEINEYLCDSDGNGGYQAGYVFYTPVANVISEIMSLETKSEKELLEDIEKIKSSAVERYLGWKTGVENMTKIVMAHFETLAYLIFKTGYDISNKNPRRTLQSLNVVNPDDISDVPTSIKESYVPPFPKVTKVNNHNGQYIREETWVGEYHSPEFLEVELVHGLINGVNEVARAWNTSGETKEIHDEESLTQLMSNGAVTTKMPYPLSSLDLIASAKPYGEHDTNEISSVLGLVALRAIQILYISSFDFTTDYAKDLGAIELLNYIDSVGSIPGEMTQRLKSVNSLDFLSMLNGEESDTIHKPTNGHWPWEFNNENDKIVDGNIVTIFNTVGKSEDYERAANESSFPGINDNGDSFEIDLTVFPYQNLSWNMFSNDSVDSNISMGSEDYVNSSSVSSFAKKNIFTVDTNIQRIGMICKNQFEGHSDISGLEKIWNHFTSHLENKIDYDEDEYREKCINGLVGDSLYSRLSFIIEKPDKIELTKNSGLLPLSSSLAKRLSENEKGISFNKIIGFGYDMDKFDDDEPGSGVNGFGGVSRNWYYDKSMSSEGGEEHGPEVRRISMSGSASTYFYKHLNDSNITITEFYGVNNRCEVLKNVSLFGELLYYKQKTDYAKAFLFLCSLGDVYNYNEISRDYICNEFVHAFVIPLASVMFFGGIIYYNRNKDAFWNIDLGEYRNIELRISNLSEQVQTRLMDVFMTWVTDGLDGCPAIRSFNEIKAGLELTIKSESKFESIEDFFQKLGNPRDGERWINNAGYDSLLELYGYTFTDSFFENYMCVHHICNDHSTKQEYDNFIEDWNAANNGDSSRNSGEIGSIYNGTKGMRLGNRDNAYCVMDAVDFALAGCLFMKNTSFFNEEKSKIIINKSELSDFFDGFISKIDEVKVGQDFKLANIAAPPENTTNDIKIGIYKYLKLLYDKWLAGMSKEEFEENWTFERFFERDDKYFHFIDTFYNIVGFMPINIGHFIDTAISCFSTDSQYSILSFLSNIYAHNKFNFLCLQNFIDLSKPENMKSMFNLVPYTEIVSAKTTPNFVVSYVNEPSSHLDIEGSEYENDSFMINEMWNDRNKWPEPLKSKSVGMAEGYRIPAFGVSYGKMYQSYFSDISVGMDNPVVTEQSIKAQYQIASQAIEGESPNDKANLVTYGQDLYAVYSNNSYTCEVTMMGCAWVQPLMYFCLTNVPMFRGTYLIQKVHHYITPGNMVTKFTGTRMANTSTRIAKDSGFYKEFPNNEKGSVDINGGLGSSSAENLIASIDNDCPYKVYPLSNPYDFLTNGSRNMQDIISEIKFSEGGYAGNIDGQVCTNKGVTLATFRSHFGKDKTCSDLKNITEEQWMTVFIEDFWKKTRASEMKNTSIAHIIIDWCFNSGPGIGIRRVKHNILGLKDDAVATDDFINAINSRDSKELFGEIYQAREAFYRNLANKPDKAKFLNGWLSRLKRIKYTEDIGQASEEQKPLNEQSMQIEGNGDKHISDVATNFVNALSRTCEESSVNIKVGIDESKSSGNTVYITNATTANNTFSKVFDVIVNGYGNCISNVKWVVGNNMDISSEPIAYLVTVKESSTYFKIHMVSESDLNKNLNISVNGEAEINSQVPLMLQDVNQTSTSNLAEKYTTVDLNKVNVVDKLNSVGGNINKNFCKVIRKKYKSYSNVVVSDTDGTLSEENAKKIFNNNDYELKDCYTAINEAGLSSYSSSNDNSKWAYIVKTMGQWYATNIHEYNSGDTEYTGTLKNVGKVRRDCTGFVSACLRAYGVKNLVWGSCNFAYPGDNGIKMMKDGGFDMLSFNNVDELKAQLRPWDIVAVNNTSNCSKNNNGNQRHAEIYAGDGKSYSWGSVHDTAKGGLPCKMGSHKFVVIWRCREIGSMT